MNKSEFIEAFREQFDETDPHQIQLDTDFKELVEWSSMVALTVIAMVDDKYRVKISGEEIRNAVTVEDLYTAIEKKVNTAN